MSGAAGTAEVPKAGCPVSNLRATLRTLTDAGFSVAVGEEAPQPFGLVKSRAPKERFVAGVVTPASPVYLNGYVELEADGDLTVVRACLESGADLCCWGVQQIGTDLAVCVGAEPIRIRPPSPPLPPQSSAASVSAYHRHRIVGAGVHADAA